MRLSAMIASVSALLLIGSSAIAETTVDRMACGDHNIRVGDTKFQVTEHCGAAEMDKDGNWYYHRDTNRIVILHFDGDKIVKITEEHT